MINIDLIELADLSRPKELAQEILKQNPDIALPIPLSEVAESVGIRDIHYERLDSIEGALVANDTKSEGIIVVNKNARHHRQRFTLGHELGHFLIPRHGSNMQCSIRDLLAQDRSEVSSQLKIEAEANQFSVEIVMPENIFKAMPEFRSEPSIENIKTIAELFDVSFEACANRYVDLHDYPIAIVFSHKKAVRYGKKNVDLPLWLKVRKGDALPVLSATHHDLFSKPNSSSCHEVDADIWFDESRGWGLPEYLVEEVFVQEDSYCATLLWFEEEIEENNS